MLDSVINLQKRYDFRNGLFPLYELFTTNDIHVDALGAPPMAIATTIQS